MKKLILIIAITFSLSAKLSAQQYYPMLDSVNIWNYVSNTCVASPRHIKTYNPCSYSNFNSCNIEKYTQQDTIIDSMIYKTIFEIGFDTCLYGFIREDTSLKKIYFRDILSNPEIILYDYSMQIGDSININFYNSGYFQSGWYTLDSITNRTIVAGNRIVFNLNNHSHPYQTLTWIESVGNIGDAVYPYSINLPGCGFCPNYPGNFCQTMTCFEHTYKIYYDSCSLHDAMNNSCVNFIDTCHYCEFCGGIPELSSVSSFEVSPTPSNGKINISMTISNPDNLEIYIRDVTGKQAMNKYSLGRLNKGNTNRELDVSNLKSGFYFLECRGNDGSSFRKLIIQE